VPKSRPSTPAPEVSPPVRHEPDSKDWISAMKAAGIDVQTLRNIAPEERRRASGAALEWQLQLEEMGSHGVAPELIEAFQRCVAATGNAPCLVLATDHSG